MLRIAIAAIVANLALLPLTSPLSAAAPAPRVELPAVKLPAADGRTIDLAEASGPNGLVIVFVSTECPISNGYLPTLNRVARDFEPLGIRCVALNPNAGPSLKQLASHAREYEFTWPVLKDAGGEVARRFGATTCPEVFVFDAQRRLVYRGRIDDRYQRRGGAAIEPREHHLLDALRALADNAAPPVAATEPLGCPIDFGVAAKPVRAPASESTPSGAPASPSIVYSRDVAPILSQRCVECHRAGGVGPFSLTTNEDARRWAHDIRDFTASGQMPPWKAGGEHGLFANERRLSDREKKVLADWVEQGLAAGDPRLAPPAREFPDTWRLGAPDLILEPATDYELGPEGPDEYRCFVIPTGQTLDRYITSIEVRPGNPRVVHHVLLFLDDGREAERLDALDPRPGYATTSGFPGFLPSGGLGGWAPGNSYIPLTRGMAKPLPANAKLVMQVHYHRSGKAEVDRTRVGLRFATDPVTRPVNGLPLFPLDGPGGGMRIPAGVERHEVRTGFVLPADVLAIGITPHMHLIGREMRVTAKLPDGTERLLIDVADWDFNWQETYRYREPIELPKGTRLDLFARFDNSADNPSNPSRPPKEMRWGEQTTNEMCIAFLEFAPRDPITDPQRLRGLSKEERIQWLLEGKRAAGETPRLPWLRR